VAGRTLIAVTHTYVARYVVSPMAATQAAPSVAGMTFSSERAQSPEQTRSLRASGLYCVIGAAIAAAGAIWVSAAPPSVSPDRVSFPFTPATFRFTEVLWTLTHVLVLLGVIGLARSGLTGPSRTGRIGSWVAVAGMALLVPAEAGYVFAANAAENSATDNALSAVFGLAVPVAGIGLLLAGAATLRSGRWPGPGRYAPLLCGVLAFALVAVQIARPSVFTWPIAVWNLAFIWFGLALRQASRQPGVVAAPQPAGIR
jgi:hypothetical protein